MDPSDTSDIIGAFTRSRGRARARGRERLNTSEPSDVSDGPQMRMQIPGGGDLREGRRYFPTKRPAPCCSRSNAQTKMERMAAQQVAENRMP
jgi:hypothetical protein